MPYGAVFRVRGIRALVASMFLARLGGVMNGVVLILFILEAYHSPSLAGIVALASYLPGTLLSPLAGALIDRYGRVNLVIVDYLVGALTSMVIVLTAAAGVLAPWLLVTIAALSSLTLPLAIAGSRSLLPLILPRELWDRGNAIDAITFGLASVAAPALGGLSIAAFGALATLAGLAAFWMVAGLFLRMVPEPPVRGAAEHHVLREAWDGLAYVLVRNRTLRALSIAVPVANLAAGILSIALPVLVLTRLQGGPAAVGILWSALGVGSIGGNLVGGRVPSQGREWLLMAAGYGGASFGIGILAISPTSPSPPPGSCWPDCSSASATSRCSACASAPPIRSGWAGRCRSR